MSTRTVAVAPLWKLASIVIRNLDRHTRLACTHGIVHVWVRLDGESEAEGVGCSEAFE